MFIHDSRGHIVGCDPSDTHMYTCVYIYIMIFQMLYDIYICGRYRGSRGSTLESACCDLSDTFICIYMYTYMLEPTYVYVVVASTL